MLRLNCKPPSSVILFIKNRGLSSIVSNAEEYTATPHYPPIEDLSYEKKLERKKEATYEEVKNVRTVEEKQIKLNMKKYYGFKCYMLKEDYIPYNNLNFIQAVTRTSLIENEQIPEYYNKLNDVENYVGSIKSDIEESISLELDQFQQNKGLNQENLCEIEKENMVSMGITKAINRALIANLSKTYPHLATSQVDLNPRIESFWNAGGMDPPENIKRYRREQAWQEVDDPTDRIMYYIGSANVAVRGNTPLLPVIPYSESDNADLKVPSFALDPRTVGTATEHRHLAAVPGFWPGDPNQFGHISYHSRGHLLKRHYNDQQDDKEAIHRQGILSSFSWLNAQANFLGFNTFNDITYPLVTQTIITNGRLWSFYIYQLNTLINHSKYVKDNPKKNVCWATPEMKLYEDVQNNKIIGFNDEVLKILIRLYANVPETRLGVNLTPYLNHKEKVSADYEEDEKREWLEREYKFLVSNRPRQKLEYEIYAWEKIYKIDNKTRFMDRKSRPFELKIKPSNRRLDDRKPPYIPRALRPQLPRFKGRDANEYFP